MFSLGDSEAYYLSRTPTDMRKGFDSLCGEVRRGMGRNPLGGEVFIFYNTNRTRVEAAPLGTRRLRDLSQALRARYSHASVPERGHGWLSDNVAGTGYDDRRR